MQLKRPYICLWHPFYRFNLRKRGLISSIMHLYSCTFYSHIFYIYRSYGVTLLIASVVAGSYQQKISRSVSLRVGTFLHAVACLCFIGLEYADGQYFKLSLIFVRALFLALGFTGRILEGVGAGLLQTSGNLDLIIIYVQHMPRQLLRTEKIRTE